MKRICIVTTLWSSINNWVKPFLNEYNKNDIEVTIVCNMDSEFEASLIKEFPFVKTYAIDFPRGISFFNSISSIIKLIIFFKKNNFNLVQYSTPNASFYSSVAAKIAGVPVRLYCQWGMVFVTMTGIKKHIFRFLEKMICRMSTNIQPDSFGNLNYCRENGFYNENKSEVIWNGSAKGLDLSKFDIANKEIYNNEIREKYNIPSDTQVIGFVGRLGKEKGCNELFKAFRIIKESFPKTVLLFVGPIEKEDTIELDLLDYFRNCNSIIKTDRVDNIEKYLSAMNMFVLPSYREGFGMSVIEAEAMELPVIATKYPGPANAIIDGETGFSINIKSVEDIVNCITYILENPDEGIKMGKNGRQYVVENFDQNVFIEKFLNNRLGLLNIM